MSHTTTLKVIDIKDQQSIRDAVKYLNEQFSLGIELLENTVPRLYGTSQQNAVGKCDFVLKLKGPYDVGLKKDKDGNYATIFDSWNGHVAKSLGSKEANQGGALYGAGKDIGRFLSAYTTCLSKNTLENEYGNAVHCTMSYDKDTDQFNLEAELSEEGLSY